MGKSILAKYDQTLASQAGVSRSDLSNALLAATSGIPLSKYYEGQTEYTIQLKTRENDGTNPQDLNDIPVWSMLPNIGKIQESDVVDVMTGVKTIDEIAGEVIKPVPLSSVASGANLLS